MFVGLVPLLLGLAGILVGVWRQPRSGFSRNGWDARACDSYDPIRRRLQSLASIPSFAASFGDKGSDTTRSSHTLPDCLSFGCSAGSLDIENRVGVEDFVAMLILPLFVLEAALTSMFKSPKEIWRQRLAVLESALPKDLLTGSVLFAAQTTGPFYADELDAMLIAQSRGVVTMNGYSGVFSSGSRIWSCFWKRLLCPPKAGLDIFRLHP